MSVGLCIIKPFLSGPQGPNMSAVTREFTYLLVKSGSVVLAAQSDLKGYTPSQVIKLKVKVHNQSGKTTSMVVASLMQVQPPTFLPLSVTPSYLLPLTSSLLIPEWNALDTSKIQEACDVSMDISSLLSSI